MALPIGLVLAGGAGRRLGAAKGGLRLAGGESLAERAAAALAPLCLTVRISVAPGAPNPAPGYATIEDRGPGGQGPLAGIGAAFEASTEGDLLVLACDYPLVPTGLLARIVEVARDREDVDVVLVRDAAGRDHPLVALWRRAMAARVADALERGRFKVGDVVAEARVERMGPEAFAGFDVERLLLNVNAPEDLARLG